MSRIPSGTVTLLFTDVEGSTRLWDSDPDAMASALRKHDEILRAAIEAAEGYVFKTVGDAASLDNPELPNNLPGLLSTFIGRDKELKTLTSLLAESRLVTLAGAGGCGKTRLALQAAAEQLDTTPDGVWFADLAPITDGSQIPAVVAAALGLRDRDEQALLTALRDADALVVLDNCEHVIEAAAGFTGRVMRGCRAPRILATSREPLGIDGERVCRVASLSLPAGDGELDGSDAVRLFLDRARGVDPGFTLDDRSVPLVAALCRRLDGIPLALELAAARLSSMALPQLVERLDRRFRLLTGGSRNVMPRQQTLQATVDWSFSLLNGTERETIRRLAVFAGGFDLEAAEAICAADGIVDEFAVIDLLHSLVAKSLVVADHGTDTVRYRLLETIRQYCAEDLLRASGEDATFRLRATHADYYLGLAQTVAPETRGPRQGDWLRRLDQERENLRSCHTELSASGRTEDVLRLCIALERFVLTRGHIEVLGWLREALGLANAAEAPASALLATALHLRVGLTSAVDGRDVPQLGTLRLLAERELAMAAELGDPLLEGWALYDLCLADWREQDITALGQRCEQLLALARPIGDSRLIASTLDLKATFVVPAAERAGIYLEGLEYYRAAGDLLSIALSEAQLFSSDLRAGTPDMAQARRHLDEGIAIAAGIGADLVVFLMHMAQHMLLLYDGDYEAAASLVRQDLLTIRRIGTDAGASVLVAAACCAAWQGRLEIAARLHGAADTDLDAAVADGSFTWTPLEREVRDREQGRLRETMGAEAFQAAYQAGSALSRHQAVNLALGR